jgi:hypothetical protein
MSCTRSGVHEFGFGLPWVGGPTVIRVQPCRVGVEDLESLFSCKGLTV